MRPPKMYRILIAAAWLAPLWAQMNGKFSPLDGQFAWRQHDGGHADAPNVKYFIQLADQFIGHGKPQ